MHGAGLNAQFFQIVNTKSTDQGWSAPLLKSGFARLFICALWSLAGKGLPSWLLFVVSNCEFVTFPLVSWVRCGT